MFMTSIYYVYTARDLLEYYNSADLYTTYCITSECRYKQAVASAKMRCIPVIR